jgi:hypothetical protein
LELRTHIPESIGNLRIPRKKGHVPSIVHHLPTLLLFKPRGFKLGLLSNPILGAGIRIRIKDNNDRSVIRVPRITMF